MLKKNLIGTKTIKIAFITMLAMVFACSPMAGTEVVVEEDPVEERYLLHLKHQDQRSAEANISPSSKVSSSPIPNFDELVDKCGALSISSKLFILFKQLKICD